jgi:Fur family ferric uptake transcriptional regulator
MKLKITRKKDDPAMTSLREAAQTLQATGRRLTTQRQVLLKVLAECHDHLDAEEIYALAKEQDPNISLATVYRTLNVFKEVGIVQERILDREGQRRYYEAGDKVHYHFNCLGCGRVIEFESPLIEQASAELAKRLNLDIVHTRVYMEGYCPDCQEEERA